MFWVFGPTAVIVSWMLEVTRDENVIVVPPPALSSALGQVTVLPSENVSVQPVIWSSALGRSYSTTRSVATACGKVSLTQLPALPETVDHSLV